MHPLSSGSVLGVTDFGPVSGSPLIPPSIVTVYFVTVLCILGILILYFRNERPVRFWGNIRVLTVTVLLFNLLLFAGGTALAAFWFIPAPRVRQTSPAVNQPHSTTARIEISFDRPLNRKSMEKSITPDVPGHWVFEQPLYGTHLYRTLAFYPTYSLDPDTTYMVKLSGIRNFALQSPAYDYQLSFRTLKSPHVASISPSDMQSDVDPASPITVRLDGQNDHMSEFMFRFDPGVSFGISTDSAKNTYTLTPGDPLFQGTRYTITAEKTDIRLNLEDGSVVERKPDSSVFRTSFITKQAPGVVAFSPSGSGVHADAPIIITFSKPMEKQSVQNSFSVQPAATGSFSWDGDIKLSYQPEQLAYDTAYTVRIAKGARSADGSFLESDIAHSFQTIGPVRAQLNPADAQSGVSVDAVISAAFDQETDHDSAEKHFSLSPAVDGSMRWDANRLLFHPSKQLAYGTRYAVTLSPGIKSVSGQNSVESFGSTFTTQFGATKLDVPSYLQQYTLSCEASALRMALAYRKAFVSEDDILTKIGFDTTPHIGTTWGNPYEAFVGNVAGTQMADGYGVYWGPIAKAARSWRPAQDFSGWTVAQLTDEIRKGNPVVIWIYSAGGTPTWWNTPDGKFIYAVRDEHSVVVVGYEGPQENPTQLIINDPRAGQVYWSRSNFDARWKIFGNSGVVVY